MTLPKIHICNMWLAIPFKRKLLVSNHIIQASGLFQGRRTSNSIESYQCPTLSRVYDGITIIFQYKRVSNVRICVQLMWQYRTKLTPPATTSGNVMVIKESASDNDTEVPTTTTLGLTGNFSDNHTSSDVPALHPRTSGTYRKGTLLLSGLHNTVTVVFHI